MNIYKEYERRKKKLIDELNKDKSITTENWANEYDKGIEKISKELGF